MISLKTLTERLETKLNSNTANVHFHIIPDTGTRKKPTRTANTITEYINGTFSLISSDKSNLVDGEVYATMSCRLRVIVRLKGGMSDEDEIIRNPDTQEILKVVEGNNTIIDRVRSVLSDAFSKNEQQTMTDTVDGTTKTYLVSTLYQFVETGMREQVEGIGDSFTFSAYISYMFVENGINTYDVKYYLDGNLIPFQTNSVYRSPTMDNNVYSDTEDGTAKALATQSTFSVSFKLPALRNSVTRLMFDWLFGGGINSLHILTVKQETWDGIFSEKSYIVTFGENDLTGESILNLGQTLTLIGFIDDYELVKIPDNYYIYSPKSTTVNPGGDDSTIKKLTANTKVGDKYRAEWYIYDSNFWSIINEGATVSVMSNPNIKATVISKSGSSIDDYACVLEFEMGTNGSNTFFNTQVNGTINVWGIGATLYFSNPAAFYFFDKEVIGYGKDKYGINTVALTEILITSEPLASWLVGENGRWDLVRAGT